MSARPAWKQIAAIAPPFAEYQNKEWRVGLDHQSFQVADRDELN